MIDVTVAVAVFGALATLLGSYAAVMVYRLNKITYREGNRQEQVKAMVHTEYEPVMTRLTSIEVQLKAMADSSAEHHASVNEVVAGQRVISDRITVLETKMEVFWKNVALDVARVLHSPNPARSHVDELLEAFMEGKLSYPKREELKDLLSYIRDYHQGDPSDFPIYPGDQVAAAILLQTMDLVRA